MPDFFRYEFELAESDWGGVQDLRNIIRRDLKEDLTETWRAVFALNDKHNADLMLFKPHFNSRVHENNKPINEQRICSECGVASLALRDDAHLELIIPDSGGACIFRTYESLALVVTQNFYQSLCDAGLNQGLATIPAKVVRGPNDDYIGLRATQPLGWPAAPYGLKRMPCGKCGNVVEASPLYAMYWSFERPNAAADWFYWSIHGSATPILSKRVHSWIRRNAPSYSNMLFPEEKEWFRGTVFGWYPEAKQSAFLPEKHHDSVLSAEAVHVN